MSRRQSLTQVLSRSQEQSPCSCGSPVSVLLWRWETGCCCSFPFGTSIFFSMFQCYCKGRGKHTFTKKKRERRPRKLLRETKAGIWHFFSVFFSVNFCYAWEAGPLGSNGRYFSHATPPGETLLCPKRRRRCTTTKTCWMEYRVYMCQERKIFEKEKKTRSPERTLEKNLYLLMYTTIQLDFICLWMESWNIYNINIYIFSRKNFN